MLDYQVEILNLSLIGEMLPLQDQYWNDVASPFHHFPPDVDWRTYLIAQQTGRLKVIVGRDKGVLKAGAVVVLGPHPHYACIAASLPLLFVHPDFRRGREGMALIKRAEEEAGLAGAQLMMTHGGSHNGVHKLFEFLQYDDFGRYFVKVLPGSNPNPVFKER